MKARLAAEFALAMSAAKFPDGPRGMVCHTIEWLVSLGDLAEYGSHKYIPADRLSEQLGLPADSGVWGYYRFGDGSFVLLTCRNALAIWSGKADDKPEFA